MWKDELIRQGKEKRMCEENFRKLLECDDKVSASYLYKKTIDWALENDYPDLETIRNHFYDLESEGLYVGKTFDEETFSSKQVFVFHDCHGTINVEMDYENAIIPMLYFANGCNLTVICRQKNIFPVKFPIYIFGKNTIYTENNDSAIFRIFYKKL